MAVDTSKLRGWYQQSQESHAAAVSRPRLTLPAATPRREPRSPIPPSLIEAAPLLLVCPVCDTLRLARPDRSLMWHQTARDGVWFDCVAVNLPGLDPEAVAA